MPLSATFSNDILLLLLHQLQEKAEGQSEYTVDLALALTMLYEKITDLELELAAVRSEMRDFHNHGIAKNASWTNNNEPSGY